MCEKTGKRHGIDWPAWVPLCLLGELRDLEQLVVATRSVAERDCLPDLGGAADAVGDALVALESELRAPSIAGMGGLLTPLDELAESLRAAIRARLGALR